MILYDPRLTPCIDPTTTREEMEEMGYRTTRDKELDRKALYDDMLKRYEKKHPPRDKRQERKDDAKADARWESRHERRKKGLW